METAKSPATEFWPSGPTWLGTSLNVSRCRGEAADNVVLRSSQVEIDLPSRAVIENEHHVLARPAFE
jgi:hypothetical protein